MFVSEWGTGIPRYEWTCSTPGNVTNSWVSFLQSALITGYHFSSAQWQLTSWCGFRHRVVLMLGIGKSAPGDVFTVTSAWLTRSHNRWMFNHSVFPCTLDVRFFFTKVLKTFQEFKVLWIFAASFSCMNLPAVCLRLAPRFNLFKFNVILLLLT